MVHTIKTILLYYVAYIDKEGYPPTKTEVHKATGIAVTTITRNLSKLEEAKLVKIGSGMRAVSVTPEGYLEADRIRERVA